MDTILKKQLNGNSNQRQGYSKQRTPKWRTYNKMMISGKIWNYLSKYRPKAKITMGT